MRRRHRDAVLFGVSDEVAAPLVLPFAPRRDDLNVGFERVVGQLEAHLIITLPRRAVRHGVSTLAARYLDLPLRDDGPRQTRAEQVDAFVDGVGLYRRPHVLLDEFLPQVFDVKLRRARRARLLVEARQLFALPHVRAVAHHLAPVTLAQPVQHHRSVQPARIGEHDLLDFLLRHTLSSFEPGVWSRKERLSFSGFSPQTVFSF